MNSTVVPTVVISSPICVILKQTKIQWDSMFSICNEINLTCNLIFYAELGRLVYNISSNISTIKDYRSFFPSSYRTYAISYENIFQKASIFLATKMYYLCNVTQCSDLFLILDTTTHEPTTGLPLKNTLPPVKGKLVEYSLASPSFIHIHTK